MAELLSYCFRDINGEILHSRDPDISLVPASNMKILSGYTSYSILGKGHKIRTSVSMEGDKLIFSGGPSPLLGSPELETIVKSVPDMGKVQEIVFNPVIFDSHKYAPAWAIGDVGYCYQAPVMPFSVNEGCYSTSKNTGSKKLHDYANRSVDDQFLNIANMASEIGEKKISYRSEALNGGNIVYQHLEAVEDILTHIETYSCNFSIEALVKYMAHVKSGNRGSWTEASRIIRDFASSLGLETKNINISDGSGLSRSNLLTTSFLSDLIVKITGKGDMDFIKLLPAPGDGTLKNRFSSHKDAGIHAKTGSLGQVASLSGYIGKRRAAFSIIINNSLRGEKLLKRTIDKLVTDFIDGSL